MFAALTAFLTTVTDMLNGKIVLELRPIKDSNAGFAPIVGTALRFVRVK